MQKIHTPLAILGVALAAALATGCQSTASTRTSAGTGTYNTAPSTATTPSSSTSSTGMGTTTMGAPSAATSGTTVPAGANDANAPLPGANKAEKGVQQGGGGGSSSGTR